MKKAGQVALFLIMGLIVVVIIILLVYGRSLSLERAKEVVIKDVSMQRDVNLIRDSMGKCLEDLGYEIVFTLGQQAGHSELLLNSFVVNNTVVGYGFYEDQIVLPALRAVENSISEYVSYDISRCINPEDYRGYSLKFSQGLISSVVEKNSVKISGDYNLYIVKGSQEYSLENEYFLDLPLRFGRLYETAEKILKDQAEHPQTLCFSCVLDIAEENDLNAFIQSYGNDTVAFVLKDSASILYDGPLEFIFATKFKNE